MAISTKKKPAADELARAVEKKLSKNQPERILSLEQDMYEQKGRLFFLEDKVTAIYEGDMERYIIGGEETKSAKKPCGCRNANDSFANFLYGAAFGAVLVVAIARALNSNYYE
jgi:hypothetical protein